MVNNTTQENDMTYEAFIDADNNYNSTAIVKLGCMEYAVPTITPVDECIDSIKSFIADTKEHTPWDTAAIAMAEKQLAKFVS
jgi:hypothetical protein